MESASDNNGDNRRELSVHTIRRQPPTTFTALETHPSVEPKGGFFIIAA
jgi:hypothetical protein